MICLVYEGNDLRPPIRKVEDQVPAKGRRFERYVKDSPIRKALDRLFIDGFGPVGATARVTALDSLSWMPLRVPLGEAARHYAFKPVALRWEWTTTDGLHEHPAWQVLARSVAELRDACRNAGARFVLVLAPAKAHVAMPLAWDQLPPQEVRRFMSVRSQELPEAEELIPVLGEYLEVVERALAAWCQENGVAFVSPTASLRRAAQGGRQVYFSYDNHWAPEGHEVVAEAILSSGVLGAEGVDERGIEP